VPATGIVPWATPGTEVAPANRGCVADIAAAAERDIVAGDIVGVGDKARASGLDLRLVGSQVSQLCRHLDSTLN
jgi:hypothetical protein